MLVLGNSVENRLQELGFSPETDLTISNILEPDTIKNALAAYVTAGAQCIVANTRDILPAVLAHQKLEARINDLAKSALKIAGSVKAQHVVVELKNCELPLDDMSKNSLIEYKEQYVTSARVFEQFKDDKNLDFDAYMLTGFKTTSQIKCALMGLRQVSDKPIFVNCYFDKKAMLNDKEGIYDYANVVAEFGATVAGFTTDEDIETAVKLCKRLRAGCDLPTLVDFAVSDDKTSPYYKPDAMGDAVKALNKAGAQFLRASHCARPAHAAILAAVSSRMPLSLKVGI